MMPTVEVVEYDPVWPQRFEALRSLIWPVVADVALRMEHVGSTSVPGLAAKPIVDADVVVRRERVPLAIERLATLGYVHQGDLGVPGREAFRHADPPFKHNLYVAVDDSLHLRNHLIVRDRLRADAELRERYGALKRELAARFPDDIDGYVEGKTAFIVSILRAGGISASDLAAIEALNRRP